MHVLVILTDMTSYCRGAARVLLLQGRDPRPQGLSRLSVFRPGQPVRARRHHQGQQGLGHPDSDPDHAQRRHHPPHPRPDRLYHRGADRAGPQLDAAPASIRPYRVLPSLSRLMKDGIGEGYTRDGSRRTLSNQLFACYAKVQDARGAGQRHRRGGAVRER